MARSSVPSYSMVYLRRITRSVARVIGSSEKMKNRNIPFLPEAVVFNILVWLPADILYNVMRFVCRSWYNIIQNPDFIKAHLFRSAIGLFIQHCDRSFSASFLEMVKGTDKVTRRKLNFKICSAFAACCDGLVLVPDPKKIEVYHVVNPITKQQMTLTPLPTPLKVSFHPVMAHARFTREYKVLYFYASGVTGDPFAVVLTVGIDNAWRLINTEHVGDIVRSTIWCKPLAGLGFIYWWSYESACVLALDVEAEIIYQVLLPKDCEGRNRVCMKSESFLTLGINGTENVWEFWALMDPNTGEWRKLFKSVLPIKNYYGRLIPIAVFKNRDLVIFRSFVYGGICVAYNVKTGIFFCYWKSHGNVGYCVIDTHVNSLVMLKS